MRLSSPFATQGPAVAVSDAPSRIYVADPARWEIRAYAADGRLSEVFRVAEPRVPVTGAMIAAALDSLVARNRGWDSAVLTEAYGRLEHPDSVTAIGPMFWDESGYLWVGRRPVLSRQPPNEFEVFGESGEWLGGVSMPPAAGSVMDIRAGRILTLSFDDLGVPYVRVYRVRGQPGP
jgi:hypothetical protein